MYNKDLSSTMKNKAFSIMDDLKYTKEQKATASKAMGFDWGGQELGGQLGNIYKKVSGINVNLDPNVIQSYVPQRSLDTPESKAVLDVMLGVDPGGEKYKAANKPVAKQSQPESPGIIDQILSFLK
jgi:hypothetical protein